LGQVHLRASAFISYSIASLCHSSAMRSYAWRRAGSVACVARSALSTDRPKKVSDESDITAQSSGTRPTSSQLCSCPQNLQGIVRRVWSLTNALRSISIPVIITRPDLRHRYTSWATGLPPILSVNEATEVNHRTQRAPDLNRPLLDRGPMLPLKATRSASTMCWPG